MLSCGNTISPPVNLPMEKEIEGCISSMSMYRTDSDIKTEVAFLRPMSGFSAVLASVRSGLGLPCCVYVHWNRITRGRVGVGKAWGRCSWGGSGYRQRAVHSRSRDVGLLVREMKSLICHVVLIHPDCKTEPAFWVGIRRPSECHSCEGCRDSAVGPVTGTRVWLDGYGYRSTQSHPPKTHTRGPGLAGFPRHSDHQTSHASHITTILSHLHMTTDTTTHPGHEPEHNDAEVGRWGGGKKDEGGDGLSCPSP